MYCRTARTLSTVLCVAFTLIPVASHAQDGVPPREHLLLAETFRLAEQVQDSVWAGWSEAPFAVLLVTTEREYLIRHPRPSADFQSLGYDELLKDTVYTRPSQFSPSLRAAFPAVGGVPTVVTGPPDSSESPTHWVLTVMHEHFHQWQMAHPGYYAEVDSLGLAQGDESGQWMLNYPFPYDSTLVQRRFQDLTRRLHAALQAVGTSDERRALEQYRTTRRAFTQTLADDDYRYFSFQLWQEGVARYVELKAAQYAATHYEPTDAFVSLSGGDAFSIVADSLPRRIHRRLTDASLAADRRVAFYSVGAAEALLLDHVHPNWRHRYWTEKFFLDRYYEAVDRRSH